MKKIILLILGLIALSFSSYPMQKLPGDYRENLKTRSEQSFKILKKKRLCQTVLIHKILKSSDHYRSLLFEALQNCGHLRPEIITLVNGTDSAYVFKGKRYGVSVNFDESYWRTKSYGVQRMVMHHEAAHIIKRHYNNLKSTFHQRQNDERTADHLAIIQGKCHQCAREASQDFILEHSRMNHTDKTLMLHHKINIHHIDHMSAELKNQLLYKTYQISKKQKKSHPIHLERALRMHKDSLLLGNSLCSHHQAMYQYMKFRKSKYYQ